MKKTSITFIINPISGVGKQKKIETLLPEILDSNKIDYNVVYTRYAKHATEIAGELKNKVDVIAVVGGDGSVHEAAIALLHSNTALAIIPTGSGNGLARHLEIPLQLKKALQLLNNFDLYTMDTGLINEQPFINAAGVGFDAHIISQFAKSTTRGLFTYIKIILSAFPLYQTKKYKISSNEKNNETEAFIVCAANITQFGNSAYIAPAAKDNDNVLDLVIIKKFPFWVLPFLSLKLFTKKILTSAYVESSKLNTFTVEQTSSDVQLDGEFYQMNSPLQFKVDPLSLTVVVPKKK